LIVIGQFLTLTALSILLLLIVDALRYHCMGASSVEHRA